jgi:hypothetical protein
MQKPEDSISVLSPDGKMVAKRDGASVLVKCLAGAQEDRHLGKDQWKDMIWAFAWSADSRLLAVAANDCIRVYEVLTGGEMCRFQRPGTTICALAFAPDGRTLASGSGWWCDERETPAVVSFGNPEAAIRLWDLASGQVIQTLAGHQWSVHTLAFALDGTTLISGAQDETVLGWDVAALTHRRTAARKISPGRFAILWADLKAADASIGQHAVAELLEAADDAVHLLERSLAPVAPVPAKRLAALIADLEHDEYIRREQASRELDKLSQAVEPTVRRTLARGVPPETRRRLADLLGPTDGPILSPHWIRTLRALQILESLGTAEARQLLQTLAHGVPEARLSQEAKAARERLGRRLVAAP